MPRPRLLFVQPNMQPPGGGTAVSAWAAQALQDAYQLDVLTWTPLEVTEINRFYGTTLEQHKLKNLCPPDWLRRLIQLDPDPWSYQPFALLMRYAKVHRDSYLLAVSFCDEVDFGKRTIQYIHFPFLGKVYHQDRQEEGHAIRWRPFRRLRPWRLLSGFSFERMKRNVTLVNSDWTGDYFSRFYNVPTQTLYPPVHGKFSRVPWEERENGFVCIGRIAQEKRFDRIIAMLAQLRAQGHDVHLHIIAARMPAGLDFGYYPTFLQVVLEHSDWVTLHENISRVELDQLLAQHRYGIHAMRNEHFGIAPAEMVRAGCIVFVCNDGGQVEIVGNEERLRYESDADAVAKIAHVLGNERAQIALHRGLAIRAELFAEERFMRQLREIVSAEIRNLAV